MVCAPLIRETEICNFGEPSPPGFWKLLLWIILPVSPYYLVNLFLIKLVRISGFSSLFLAIAVFSAHSARVLKTLRSLRKEEENPEILTN